MKIDPKDFNYIMYVDASGDDGFQFQKDSSLCYATAALLVKREDIDHNLEVLAQIKKTVGCKPTDEVKYSSLRRHPRGKEALSLLKDIKGKLSSYVVFKKELPLSKRPPKGSKTLSAACHLMAIHSLDKYSFQDHDKVLIAIDRMKHTEEVPIEKQLKVGILSDAKKTERNFTTETVFRDSKDSNYLLIQIADFLCGILREHFEQYETNSDMAYFKGLCRPCRYLKNKPRSRPLCKQGKDRAERIINSKNLSNIMGLFHVTQSVTMAYYFFMEPESMVYHHFYMMCDRKK